MEQSKAKLLVAILFQIRKVSNLTNSTLTIQDVDAELNRLMGEILSSEEELDFSDKLVPLQKYVTTTRQNIQVFEELNTLLLQLQILLKQSGIHINAHV